MKTLVSILAFILGSMLGLFAQQIPVDPEVKTGKLENGMTYYIRHNALPKERANFYLACNVGAVLEEDHENGLSHFVEHMAFNGSKHFKGNGVIDYLGKIGIKLGETLTATTRMENTVYQISGAPIVEKEVIDSCLLILYDWAGHLSMEDKEIEKERGVIREEMRTVVNYTYRLRDTLLKQIAANNPHAKRNVIGTEDIIMNFEPDVIRNFYKKWYRPDLQAIVVVGDIDPDLMEKKIKTLFSSIPAPVNPAERLDYPVEDNESILVGIATDKETPYTMLSIDYKHPPMSREEKASIDGMATDYIHYIASYMGYNRMLELMEQPVPPFQDGIINNDKFMDTFTESWQGTAVVRENEFELGMKTLAREMERINRFGFTASEYEIAKLNYFSLLENTFNEQDNNYYAQEYVDHFLDGGYIPGIKMQYEISKEIAAQISLEMINEYIQDLMGEKNIVISLMASQKEGVNVPTKDQLLTWFNEVKKEELTPYQEKVFDKPLLSELPLEGKIVNETAEGVFGTTILTLNNGVKVVIKPTELKKDEIFMAATSPGGTSHFPENDPVNIALYKDAANLGGVGEFSNRELTTMLAGKNVSVNPVINTTTEGFEGSSSKRDFETMLQLIYLHFTASRQDDDAFQSYLSRTKSTLESEQSIITVVRDSLRSTAYANKARNYTLTANDLNQANYPTIMKWRKDRYSDAGDFTFIFTGSIETEELKELIARYLGALPTTGRKETYVEITDGYRTGHIQNAFNRKMEVPQAIVVQKYPVLHEMILANEIKIDMLAQILNTTLNEVIREEKSDVYNINAVTTTEEYPAGLIVFQINYFTEPGKEVSINEDIKQIISKLCNKGPQDTDLRKAKEFLLMNQQAKEQQNEYWVETLTDFHAKSYNGYTNYANILNSITADEIKETAKMVFGSGNCIEVMLSGEL